MKQTVGRERHAQNSINVLAEEYKEVCPYDKIHRIVPERFQKHLIQCRRMHPDEPLDTCPFDSTHIFGACERSVSYLTPIIFVHIKYILLRDSCS